MENPQQNQNKPQNPGQNQLQNSPQNKPQAPAPVKPYDKFLAKQPEKQAEKKTENQPKKEPGKPEEKKFEYQPLVVVGAILLAGLAWFFLYHSQARKEASLLKTPEVEEEANNETENSNTESENEGEVAGEATTPASPVSEVNYEVKTFNSGKLGIAFNYNSPVGTSQVAAREAGNKIYIDRTNLPSELAVEVFEKDRDASLKEAIVEEFLEGVSWEECFPVDMETNVANPDYRISKIFFPSPGMGDCGSYNHNNFTSYFIMNIKVPGKFILVHGGQYSNIKILE